jgi:hypothetical protein
MTAALQTVVYEDITAAMRTARISVANARIWAFEDECVSLGAIVHGDPVRRREITDFLVDLATANGLVRVHGIGLIEQMIYRGLRAGQ